MTSHLRIGQSTALHRLGVKRPTRKVIRAQRRVGLFADPIEVVVRGTEKPQMFACRRCGTMGDRRIDGAPHSRGSRSRGRVGRRQIVARGHPDRERRRNRVLLDGRTLLTAAVHRGHRARAGGRLQRPEAGQSGRLQAVTADCHHASRPRR